MPRKQNTDNAAIRSIGSKRNSVSVHQLKKRRAAGEDISGKRAFIRIGPALTSVLVGIDDLSDWDEEELVRGQRRDKNGQLRGKQPQMLPVNLHNELVRRRLRRAEGLLRDAVVDAVQALVDIANGSDVEDKDRLKAISMIMDRVMGKAPERIEVKAVKSKMQEAFRAMLVPDDDSDVIDVEARDTDDTD